jgi:predicted ATP-dependent serine protease
MKVVERKAETSGRKPKQQVDVVFNPDDIKLFRGSELSFNDSLFKPFKTNSELDIILSTDGGLMPGVSLMFAGGPGSGKTTVVLDMLSKFTQQGYKALFISGEMDEVGHYKYCKRMPHFDCVQTLFLKDYIDNVKEVIEYVFNNFNCPSIA